MIGVAALFATACVEPGAARIVGPDGTQMLHVHCGDDQVACFQIAGEACPHGYYLSPIFDPHDGNFLVRCRAPLTSVAIAPQYTPVPSAAPAAQQYPSFVTRDTPPVASPEQPWPPAEVARPTEPWPNSTSATSTKQGAIGDVDLGY